MSGPGDDVHVIPQFGRSHEASVDCWCSPRVDDGVPHPSGARLWIHQPYEEPTMNPPLTLQDLAETAHRAYQAAPQEERWQAVARAILAILNSRAYASAVNIVTDDGEIVEQFPPLETP